MQTKERSVPLCDAIQAMAKLDKLFEELTDKLSALRGEGPSGQLGLPIYCSVRQVLTHARARKTQIERLMADIAVEEKKLLANVDRRELELDELESIFGEFGISM